MHRHVGSTCVAHRPDDLERPVAASWYTADVAHRIDDLEKALRLL